MIRSVFSSFVVSVFSFGVVTVNAQDVPTHARVVTPNAARFKAEKEHPEDLKNHSCYNAIPLQKDVEKLPNYHQFVGDKKSHFIIPITESPEQVLEKGDILIYFRDISDNSTSLFDHVVKGRWHAALVDEKESGKLYHVDSPLSMSGDSFRSGRYHVVRLNPYPPGVRSEADWTRYQLLHPADAKEFLKNRKQMLDFAHSVVLKRMLKAGVRYDSARDTEVTVPTKLADLKSKIDKDQCPETNMYCSELTITPLVIAGMKAPKSESVLESIERIEMEVIPKLISEKGKTRQEWMRLGVDRLFADAGMLLEMGATAEQLNLFRRTGELPAFIKLEKDLYLSLLLAAPSERRAMVAVAELTKPRSKGRVIGPADIFDSIFDPEGTFSYVGSYVGVCNSDFSPIASPDHGGGGSYSRGDGNVDVTSVPEHLESIVLHQQSIEQMLTLPSGNILTVSKDETMKEWNPLTGEIKEIESGIRASGYSEPTLVLLIKAADGFHLQVRNTKTGEKKDFALGDRLPADFEAREIEIKNGTADIRGSNFNHHYFDLATGASNNGNSGGRPSVDFADKTPSGKYWVVGNGGSIAIVNANDHTPVDVNFDFGNMPENLYRYNGHWPKWQVAGKKDILAVMDGGEIPDPAGNKHETTSGLVHYNLSTKKQQRVIPIGGKTNVRAFTISPDGNLLIAQAEGNGDESPVVSNLETGTVKKLEFPPFVKVDFLDDGRIVSALDGKGNHYLLDAKTFAPLKPAAALPSQQPLHLSSNFIQSSDDGKTVAYLDGSENWRVYDLPNRKEIAVVPAPPYPQGDRLQAYKGDKVWVINPKNGKVSTVTLDGPVPIRQRPQEFKSPDGKKLFFSAVGKQLTMVDLETGDVKNLVNPLPPEETGWSMDGYGQTWSPDGRWFTHTMTKRGSGRNSDEYGAVVVDLKAGTSKWIPKLKLHDVSYSKDGKYIVAQGVQDYIGGDRQLVALTLEKPGQATVEKALTDYNDIAGVFGEERQRELFQRKSYIRMMFTKGKNAGTLDREKALKLMNSNISNAEFRGYGAGANDERHILGIIDSVFPVEVAPPVEPAAEPAPANN